MVSSTAILHRLFNLASGICLHTVKWLKNSSLSIDKTPKAIIIPCLRQSGSNGNEGVLDFRKS